MLKVFPQPSQTHNLRLCWRLLCLYSTDNDLNDMSQVLHGWVLSFWCFSILCLTNSITRSMMCLSKLSLLFSSTCLFSSSILLTRAKTSNSTATWNYSIRLWCASGWLTKRTWQIWLRSRRREFSWSYCWLNTCRATLNPCHSDYWSPPPPAPLSGWSSGPPEQNSIQQAWATYRVSYFNWPCP